MSYNRDNVVSYAKQYAYNYNPNYIDYATYEGSSDCANFVSQCLYAGGIAMTDTWYLSLSRLFQPFRFDRLARRTVAPPLRPVSRRRAPR